MILKLLRNPYFIILILSGIFFFVYQIQQKKINNIRVQLEVARNNEKAYEKGVTIWKDAYNQEHATSLAFQETLKSLRSSQDSTTKKIYEVLKSQDVNFKKLERIVYSSTAISTTLERKIEVPIMLDSVMTFDLSNENITNVVDLYLSKDSTKIKSHIKLENEIYGTFTIRRETVEEPKKFFICRWFQAKHTLIEADLFNSNPLIKTKNQKIIQIVD